MKKGLVFLMIVMLFASISIYANGSTENVAGDSETWSPSKNIEWVVTSSPGGGSDIFTRMISDIITTKGFVNQTIVVNNQTDGGGEVGRLRVSQAAGDGHILLIFNSGDLSPMVRNTPKRVSDFRPVAILAADRHLLLAGKKTPYDSITDAFDAAKSGKKVIIGGSKGDDLNIYNMLKDQLGVSEDQLTYIMYDATSDAITALLGGHVDYCIGKPAASTQYILSGDATAVVAFANVRFTGSLKDVPLLSEIGDYENIESPIWRGVVTSAKTPDYIVAFWSDVLEKVSETEEWQKNYIEKNQLSSDFMNWEEATAYMQEYENKVLNK